MPDILTFLGTGIILGLLAGISPGPMLTLVISQTLQYNIKEGFKISLSPLVTDFPIILITVLLLSNAIVFKSIIAAISLVGALFLIYMAYECLVFKNFDFKQGITKPYSLKKGIVANFFNPYPYIFWFTVGTPFLFRAYHSGITCIILFLTGFYSCLVGSKIIVVYIVGSTKASLNSTVYHYIIRTLGMVLMIFSLLFLKEGLKSFGMTFPF
jgi:threonine/homoserine/homoserine lactone efflux protein